MMEICLPLINLKFERFERINPVWDVSKEFNRPLVNPQLLFTCIYKTADAIALNGLKPCFSGHSFAESVIPCEWKIFRADSSERVLIYIHFFNQIEIAELLATVDCCQKLITVEAVPAVEGRQLSFDPLFHPLGSLLMIYLAGYSRGFLIHASGVDDGGKGFLFTGRSGIGKSTMSRLWSNEGATVVNDDRMWIQQVNGIWTMFSIPMMHYAQKPAMAPLSKIFLLSQNRENTVQQVAGAKGALLLMQNCIQHLFDRQLTTSHVDAVFNAAGSIPVYELGFKPDSEIVEIIRTLH